MVSIPDWTKFAGGTFDAQKKDEGGMLSKHFIQSEVTAIKRAHDIGYFLDVTEHYLLKHMGPFNGTKKRMTRLFMIRLDGLRVRKLGAISACSSLQICILHTNFLTRIDDLATCQQLVKLDLHSNQITQLPDSSFWKAQRKLRALYLHDNPLGKFETLQSLAACPKLSILTLYNTPLHLKKNYRHHVVNSIYTLKALDHYVVSDEEIIEDAIFGGHFTALSPIFKLDLCPLSPPDGSFRDEVKEFQKLEAQVNAILAKHSPVLIIQRYIRGYLARSLGLVKPRSRQTLKTIPHDKPLPAVRLRSPGSSPDLLVDKELTIKGGPPPPSPMFPDDRTGGDAEPTSWGRRLNIHIDLAKLEDETLETLNNDRTRVDPRFQPPAIRSPRPKKEAKEKEGKGKEGARIKDIQRFFGPMVHTRPDGAGDRPPDTDADLPFTKYRLDGRRPYLLLYDRTSDMLLSKMESGMAVREAEREQFKKRMMQPPPYIVKRPGISNSQRLFARVCGTMEFSCLFAVQDAYREREKAQKAAVQYETVAEMRKQRMRGKERSELYQEVKRARAMRQHDRDRAKLQEQAEKLELARLNYLDRRHEIKGRCREMARNQQSDNDFLSEFNAQHASVSKALKRHDRQQGKEEQKAQRQKKVADQRMDTETRLMLVKRYLQHKQDLQQTESSFTRSALDAKLVQETSERMMQAKQNVSRQKAKEDKVVAFYPLPPAVASAPAELSRRYPLPDSPQVRSKTLRT